MALHALGAPPGDTALVRGTWGTRRHGRARVSQLSHCRPGKASRFRGHVSRGMRAMWLRGSRHLALANSARLRFDYSTWRRPLLSTSIASLRLDRRHARRQNPALRLHAPYGLADRRVGVNRQDRKRGVPDPGTPRLRQKCERTPVCRVARQRLTLGSCQCWRACIESLRGWGWRREVPFCILDEARSISE